LLSDTHLIDKLAAFDRQRIPERVVHAKGAGAHGYFEVTVSKCLDAAARMEVSNSILGFRSMIFRRSVRRICSLPSGSAPLYLLASLPSEAKRVVLIRLAM
jgi:hypothetical protein